MKKCEDCDAIWIVFIFATLTNAIIFAVTIKNIFGTYYVIPSLIIAYIAYISLTLTKKDKGER